MLIRRAALSLTLLAVTLVGVYLVVYEEAREEAKLRLQSWTASDTRENAVFVTLCRNDDLMDMKKSIRQVESRFNKRFHYDWIFLNNEDFTDDFKEQIKGSVSGKAVFGKVPEEHWSYPEWIDLDKAAETRLQMKQNNVRYGDLESYHFMCRYYSGFFYKHPLLKGYKYYWRVEPGIKIECDIKYDVFTLMRQGEYTYGWTVAPKDIPETIESLWGSVQKFLGTQTQTGENSVLADNNLKEFLTDDGGKTYNTCHFWSNFEIADLDFWRSELYQNFFDSLDRDGGFFYERWGDAPVHSIAAALFLNRDQIHFFDDIGYFHSPYGHCPINQGIKEIKCSCHPDPLEFSDQIYDWHKNSCVRNYLKAKNVPFVDGNPDYKS